MLAAESSSSTVEKLSGVVPGFDALLLGKIAQDNGFALHIVSEEKRLEILANQLAFFCPKVQVLQLPGWDCLPYDRISPHPEIISLRMRALSTLAQGTGLAKGKGTEVEPTILLMAASSLIQRLPPKDLFVETALYLKSGLSIGLNQIITFLEGHAYHRTETVREVGEYAVRGGIIDIFPVGFENPVRVDFFGDEIDSLKQFDALSQLTTKTIKEVSLFLAQEVVMTEETQERFRHGYRNLFGAVVASDPLYESIQAGQRHAGMEHWLPLFYERTSRIQDFLPESYHLSFDEQAAVSAEERLEHIQEYYASRQEILGKEETPYRPLPPKALYLKEDEWQDVLNLPHQLFTSQQIPDGKDHGVKRVPSFAAARQNPDLSVYKEVESYIQDQRVQNRQAVITAYSDGAKARLITLFAEHNTHLKAVECQTWQDVVDLEVHQVAFITLDLDYGFTAPGFVFLTEQDIVGDRLARPVKRKRKSDAFIAEVSALQEGDLVVHEEHGIARYDGLETLVVDRVSHDCLRLIYAGNDRLFLPVENLDMLSKFGHDEGSTQLDKLGGAGWQARKAKVKKDLLAMAGELLKVAAARKIKQGESFVAPKGTAEEFAMGFPFAETNDQLVAIEETLHGLQSGPPMDRLVCGDVGFGKTEIALRAAFTVAMNGAQVAVIVPTTLLARQHAANFKKRFEGFPVQVSQLSRLVKPADAARVKEGLRKGDVNIVIGTHALLAESIKFADLGLVIVDEEQRFGVKQKERLKSLKDDVHVLTLTATPIPRTLQLSLTGVKDLSLISTPPVDRLAVRTFVMPFDGLVVREAILREKHRGGQSFYVVPRIKDLKEVAEKLDEILPDVKYAVAHGQMAPADLEDVMTAFMDGKYDVLLSTHIVESGLDISTANTMIIHRADMFGLAQLYQLRGRVGRSKVRAYAYLTLDPKKRVTDQAKKRLEVMQTLDHLGAGFSLASHDMDIRGAGNLLGEEQSGHIKEVGIELYQQMLEEAVAARKEGVSLAEEGEETWSPQINIGTSVLIPEKYVSDLNVRLALYRRIADLQTREEIDSFAAELIDRFGKLPPEVDNLFDIVALKSVCRKACVEKVEAGPKGGTITFHNNIFPNPDKLIEFIQSQSGTVKVKPDQRLTIIRPWNDLQVRVGGVRQILSTLATLAN